MVEFDVIFCDGACSGNPGPGGWGTVVLLSSGHVIELSGRANHTTNNQMELRAAIEGIRCVRARGAKGPVTIYTDSVYVIRGINQWIYGWEKRGWLTQEGKPVSNKDLWLELKALKQGLKVEWKFVKGHSGVPGNERCDHLAVEESQGRRTQLYEGPLKNYSIDLLPLPPDQALPVMKSKPSLIKTSKNKQSGSETSGNRAGVKSTKYLSYSNGVISLDPDWASCERKVKGRPGAKYKKVGSLEEARQILTTWGVSEDKISASLKDQA